MWTREGLDVASLGSTRAQQSCIPDLRIFHLIIGALRRRIGLFHNRLHPFPLVHLLCVIHIATIVHSLFQTNVHSNDHMLLSEPPIGHPDLVPTDVSCPLIVLHHSFRHDVSAPVRPVLSVSFSSAPVTSMTMTLPHTHFDALLHAIDYLSPDNILSVKLKCLLFSPLLLSNFPKLRCSI